jgi:hypothetical protein
MEKQNKLKIHGVAMPVLVGFLMVELMIYSSFMYLDIKETGSYVLTSKLKFIGIILCFVFTLFFDSKKEEKTDIYLLRGALLFTMISDLFILMLDYYYYGMITFCVVQLLYLIRLYRFKKQQGTSSNLLKLILRNIVLAIVIIGILFSQNVEIDELVCISIIYFISILLNTFDAICIQIKTRKYGQKIYAIGMILFVLCDINVGLFNISDFAVINGAWFVGIYEFASIAMWMFYLPAQVCIALSGNSSM